MKEKEFDKITKEDLMDLKKLMETIDPENKVFNTPKEILEETIKNEGGQKYENIEKILKKQEPNK